VASAVPAQPASSQNPPRQGRSGAQVTQKAAPGPFFAGQAASQVSLGGSLQDHGLRLTRQRKLLFDIIDAAGEHLNAEALYRLAKERDPRINRVTVYRTLKLLKQEGLVDELDLLHHEGDQHYYETRLKQEHAHVVCVRCGRVEEFFGDALKRLRQQIESHFGFQILVARTEVGGYCANCQMTAAREAEELRNGAASVREKATSARSKPRASVPSRAPLASARGSEALIPSRDRGGAVVKSKAGHNSRK